MWPWSKKKEVLPELPEVLTRLLQEVGRYPEAELGGTVAHFAPPHPDECVSKDPLPLFLRKTFATINMTADEMEVAHSMGSADIFGYLAQKKHLLETMLGFYVYNIPRPADMRHGVGARVCKDFRVAFRRRAGVVIVPFASPDSDEQPADAQTGNDNEPDPGVPPEKDKKRVLH